VSAEATLRDFIALPFQDRWGSVETKASAAVDELVRERDRYRSALEIIANRTYPATYVGIVGGVKTYGAPDDVSHYAQRILDGEQVT